MGAYALDAVEEGEREQIDSHLAECSICADEVAAHREVVAVLLSDGAPPPSGLWDRVVGQLDSSPPPLRLVPVDAAAAKATKPGRFLSAMASVAAIAAAVTAVVGIAIFQQSSDIRDLEERLASGSIEQAAITADGDPTNPHLSLASVDGRYIVDVVMTDEWHGFITGGELPEIADGRAYQLWGIGTKGPVSLGIIGDEAKLEPVAFVRPPGANRLAITIEDAGGSVVPTSPPVVTSAAISAFTVA